VRHAKRRKHVGAEHGFGLVEGHVHQRCVSQHAGIADHDVDVAGACGEVRDESRVVEVAGDDLDGLPAALLRQRVELGLAPSRGQDPGAGLDQRDRRGSAYARARAGDERPFARQSLAH
jgi:hypothetical protein